jgi:hypothetical protein
MDEMNSIQGHYITRMGGAILWGVHREKRISGSSCEAEIKAMDDGTKAIQFLRHLIKQLRLKEATDATPLLNDNRGSCDWTNNGGIVSKKLRHANISEFRVLEAAKHNEINVHWIPGKDNPADLFTKEHKDVSQFNKLRDLMVRPREWIYQQSSKVNDATSASSSDSNTNTNSTAYSTSSVIKSKKLAVANGTEKRVRIAKNATETVTFGVGNKYPPITCILPTKLPGILQPTKYQLGNANQ